MCAHVCTYTTHAHARTHVYTYARTYVRTCLYSIVHIPMHHMHIRTYTHHTHLHAHPHFLQMHRDECTEQSSSHGTEDAFTMIKQLGIFDPNTVTLQSIALELLQANQKLCYCQSNTSQSLCRFEVSYGMNFVEYTKVTMNPRTYTSHSTHLYSTAPAD